jgi:N-acyl-D-amino-acid deacylase
MPQHAGRDLDDIAREMGVDRTEAAKRLIPGGAIYFMMGEEDVRRVLAYPGAMIGSDGIPGDAHPHPRLWGTFPRVLGHYCRDLKLMSLEEAIRRMTSLPARNFNLKDRGEIRLGAFADLVVFDAASIADRATFEKPIQASAGIDHVLVNGVEILAKGQDTGARPGLALRRAG